MLQLERRLMTRSPQTLNHSHSTVIAYPQQMKKKKIKKYTMYLHSRNRISEITSSRNSDLLVRNDSKMFLIRYIVI